MTCSVQKENVGLAVSEMRDGDIGVVIEWENCMRNVGVVVQRCASSLIVIGARSGASFPHATDADCGCRVRLLSPGDTIRIDSIDAK